MRVPVKQTDNTYHVTVSNADNAATADRLTDGVLTQGFTAPQPYDGTFIGGTYEPLPKPNSTSDGGNWRKITNGGAFTLAAPTESGSFSMTIDITNVPGAGAITFTGFATGYPKGDQITTTNGDVFKLHIDKSDAGVTGFVEALQ